MDKSYQFEEMEIYPFSIINFKPEMVLSVIKFVRDKIFGLKIAKSLPHLKVCRNFETDIPAYIKPNDGSRWIVLKTDGGEEDQLLYQFSHEYMHYYIDVCNHERAMVCQWLEESLCCLSSLIHLLRYAEAYPDKEFHWNNPAGASPKNALCDHAYAARQEVPDTLFQTLGIRSFAHLLPMKHEGVQDLYRYYNVIAVRMMPYFVQNPDLWKILPYLRTPLGCLDAESYLDRLITMCAGKRNVPVKDLRKIRRMLFP